MKVFSKHKFTRDVKQIIYNLNRKHLLETSKGYKKINYDELSLEDFRMKPNFKELTIPDARLRFKISARVTPQIMNNFHNVKKYKDAGYL